MKYFKPCLLLSLFVIIMLLLLNFNKETFVSNKKNYFTNPVYLFWTGGYDSTFRLCQLLLIEKATVQPIYISDPNLDNDPGKNTKRHNHSSEYNAMNTIRKNLNKKFPFTKKTLLKTMDINNINLDPDIKHNMKILAKQKRMRRSTSQYGGMAQVSRDLDANIEVSIEKAEHNNGFFRTINTRLIDNKKNADYRNHIIRKNLDVYDQPLKIFKNFVFPIIFISKKEMYKISKKNNFDDIMRTTWSCWYPVNNKPCKKCIMCRERLKFN